MQNLKYTCIIVVIICIFLYVYWLKLKRGKGGRIPGREVEKKTFKEALVVDTRWRTQYEKEHAVNAICVPIKVLKEGSKILDNYKNKDIILYCVVDITSRNTEKILKERGFTKLHIGDGVKQYNYGKAKFKNVLMSELKYILTTGEHVFVNLGTEQFKKYEIKATLDNVVEKTKHIEVPIITYSNNEEDSLEAAKILSKEGKNVINLIEPMNAKKYLFTPMNKKDFISKISEKESGCGS